MITTLAFKEYNTFRLVCLLGSTLGAKEKKYAQDILFLSIRREYGKDRGNYTSLIQILQRELASSSHSLQRALLIQTLLKLSTHSL